MRRYDTKLEDGRLYVEWDDDWLDLGEMATIREIFGGDTYEIEYDDKQATVPWLEDTLEDNTFTFDVTETLIDMDFDREFVEEMAEESLEDTGSRGQPARTEAFADRMMEIWNAQGRDVED